MSAKLTDAERLANYASRVGWVGNIPEGHYAIRDPHEPARVTSWRVKAGRLTVWPKNARVGPIVYRRDLPKGRAEQAAVVAAWMEDRQAYFATVRAALGVDPAQAAARYAAVSFRCAMCNRSLRAAESNGYGIGPECRRWMPADLLSAAARAASLVRGEVEHGGGDPA